jgi:hypothetical protein
MGACQLRGHCRGSWQTMETELRGPNLVFRARWQTVKIRDGFGLDDLVMHTQMNYVEAMIIHVNQSQPKKVKNKVQI